jgi:hypothetical protein
MKLRIYCHDPNLGLMTKARPWKVWAKNHIHTPKNVKECEGMSPYTPKWILTLGVGVPMDFLIFRERFEGSKIIGLKTFLYHWKVLKT